MLDMNDMTIGTVFELDDDPVKVLSVKHTKMGRQGATVTIKIKNLRTGNVLEKTIRPADHFREAVIDKKKMRFEFAHRGNVTFVDPDNLSKRIVILEKDVEDTLPFLPQKTTAVLLYYNDNIIGVELPPKVDLKITTAPPGIKGDTASGATKQVETETGLLVATPLFINEGDIIRVNTETGEYVERVEKA